MKYISTRGQAPILPFDDVLLTGLARDGGLYLPESWPAVSAADFDALQELSYADLALRIMRPFIAGTIDDDALGALVTDSYKDFGDDPAPIKDLGGNLYLMELFHGPTLAFKDYALQVLGRLFDHVLKQRNQRVTIVGATSGDTGSAAIEACRDRDSIDIFILHPKGRVSDVQRRQMTTVPSSNVYNIAVEGTFDDCQDLVKAMFNDQPFRDRHNLSAVNSINWARIMAQIVYYFYAALQVRKGAGDVAFAVPTGNFGNVFAGYAATQMGLPVTQLVVGSNSNDILTRFFESGAMTMLPVTPTISPSMDIQISSNFERLMFDLYGRDGAKTAEAMESFREKREITMEDAAWQQARKLFEGARFDDAATKDIIRQVYEECGELLDPHSAVGVAAARAVRRDASVPMVALATAHPAKFPVAVEEATGLTPALPDRLADLFERSERYENQPNDLLSLQRYIAGKVTS